MTYNTTTHGNCGDHADNTIYDPSQDVATDDRHRDDAADRGVGDGVASYACAGHTCAGHTEACDDDACDDGAD